MLEVVVPDLQAFLLAVDELEALIETPAVLLHEVGHQDSGGAGLAVQRVDEAALPHLHGLLDEVANGIDCVVFLVEDLRNDNSLTFSSF